MCSEKKNKRQKAEEMHREVLETGSKVLGEELMLLSKNSSSDERLCWCAPRRKTSGKAEEMHREVPETAKVFFGANDE